MLLPRGVTAVSVSSAAAHSLVLTSTGAVYAVGDNTYGELGTGTDASSTVPVPVVFPAGTVIVAVSAGDGSGLGLAGGYSLALSSTGVVYAWGDNESGDLGDGSNTNSDLPAVVQVPDGVVPTSVVAGGNRAHLLSSAGQVYDWGTDEKGTHIHLTPLLDPQAPDGATPLLIASGPDAEQYLALMAPTAAS
jgi:alpha-tubulin suppressor-like RCC1 family protein